MKLNIGGHNYNIECLDLQHEDSSKELYGRHLVRNSEILINNKINKERQEETLIHEIIHAILVNAGHEHDEGIIDALSNGLFQLGVGDYLWKKAQKKS
tara:strand:- start:344 stop:637 length:294 start_codon:yes stop_codon:yes gene_type:complete